MSRRSWPGPGRSGGRRTRRSGRRSGSMHSSATSTFRVPSVAEAEQPGRQVDAHHLELLDELGADAGRLQTALDLAVEHAGLLEDEDVLHDDDVTLHALDLGDVGDPSR